MPVTSASLVHVDDFGSLIKKPIYCGSVHCAVVGRVVILTFVPDKVAICGNYQISERIVNA